MDYLDYCRIDYKSLFDHGMNELKISNLEDRRRFSQKRAIKQTAINAINKYPDIEPTEIWKTIYVSHVNNFSGIIDQKIIDSVISADNSWKKSSGHAFEEIIKDIGNLNLNEFGIVILLQKELNLELHNNNVLNEVRDISWLKEQVKSSIFDLYLALKNDNKYLVFGCVQSKTSIRDRVTRDREPSINAMKAFFFSIAIVMDGDFLKLPKFQNMVNGHSTEYEINGWHYMYVFTNKKINNDRIISIDINMDNMVSHIKDAALFWKIQRQWFDHKWKA